MIFWRVVNIFQNRFFQRCYVTFTVFVINGTARTNFVCFFQYDASYSNVFASYPADVRLARTVLRAQISKNCVSRRSARSEPRKTLGAERNDDVSPAPLCLAL